MVVEDADFTVVDLGGIEVMEGSDNIVLGVGTNVLDKAIPSGGNLQAHGDQTIVTFNIFLGGSFSETVGVAGEDADIVDSPVVTIGIGAVVVKALITDTDGDVALTGNLEGKGYSVETFHVAVDFDIDTGDIDLDFLPSGGSAGVDFVVKIAEIVEFAIELIETDIDNSGCGSVDVVNLDEAVEVTGSIATLVNHAAEHVAVGSGSDRGVGKILHVANEIGDTIHPRSHVGINLSFVDKGKGVNIGNTTPESEVSGLGVAFNTSDNGTGGVTFVLGMEVYGCQGNFIFGEDGADASVTVLNSGGLGLSLNLTLLVKGRGLCESKGCAQGESENH